MGSEGRITGLGIPKKKRSVLLACDGLVMGCIRGFWLEIERWGSDRWCRMGFSEYSVGSHVRPFLCCIAWTIFLPIPHISVMSTNTYTLSSIAYALPLLHAARHTSYTVVGLLLGSAASTGEVNVQDAVPLLHNYTSLTPMAEVGLSLVQAEAKSRSLSIVGVYVIYDGDITGLGRVGERVLQELKKDFDGAIGLRVSTESDITALACVAVCAAYLKRGRSSADEQVDNTRLGKGEFPYTVYPATNPSKPLSAAAGGLPSSVKLLSDASIKSTLSLIRTDKAHQLVEDFDDHLEDPYVLVVGFVNTTDGQRG